MNIQEKFTKILETNDLNIKSIHGLEKFSGVGIGSISKFLNAGEGPSLGTIKKIHASLGINPEWWKTGKGDVYIKKGTSEPIFDKEKWIFLAELQKDLETWRALAVKDADTLARQAETILNLSRHVGKSDQS